jgi:hypothetical protein
MITAFNQVSFKEAIFNGSKLNAPQLREYHFNE